MADFSLWTKPIQARLGGAVLAVITAELLEAARDFYLRSNAWQSVLGGFALVADEEEVGLTPPADAELQLVLDVWLDYGGDEIYPLHALTRPPLRSVDRDRPRDYFVAQPAVLQLRPIPSASEANVLKARCSLVPALGAAALPDIARAYHYEGILAGALARLFAMPNKPYTNADMALYYERRFNRKIGEARDAANRGNSHADSPFRFPPFA